MHPWWGGFQAAKTPPVASNWDPAYAGDPRPGLALGQVAAGHPTAAAADTIAQRRQTLDGQSAVHGAPGRRGTLVERGVQVMASKELSRELKMRRLQNSAKDDQKGKKGGKNGKEKAPIDHLLP